MRIELAHRHYGVHARVRDCEVTGVSASWQGDEPVVDEAALLAALPDGFLPVPPSKVLLMVDAPDGMSCKAVAKPTLFRPWGKYFDAYSLTVVPEAGHAG